MSPQELPLVWLQGGGCTGCTVSLANSAFPSLRNILIDQILPGTHISLAYHPTLMAAQGSQGLKILDALPDRGFVLGIEGSIPENEEFCCVGRLEGRELTVLEKFI